MQNGHNMVYETPQQHYSNYYGTPYSPKRIDNCPTTSNKHQNPNISPRRLSPQLNKSPIQRETSPEYHPRPLNSLTRRSLHSDGPRQFEFSQQQSTVDPQAYRSTFRAPTLRANGRSLSARDSQEEFQQLEKMKGHTMVLTKRLLPVTPSQQQSIPKLNNRLSFDASFGGPLENLEHQLRNQLALNEKTRSKEKSPQYTKRSQSPRNESRLDSTSPTTQSVNNFSSVNSPKKLGGCSRRLNFQLSHQKSLMGQENSRPPPLSNSSFSNSFDSSTVYNRVALANTRADSTASDDANHQEMHLNTVKTPHANSTGSLQVDSNLAPVKQKRSMNELYSSSKNSRSNNTLAPSKSNFGKTGNGRTSKKSSQNGISNASQSIINFCVENSKGDIASRVINRMANKREDFNMFISNLSPKQYSEFTNSLREYFASVVQHLQSTEKISTISASYGEEQVTRRTWGFKADYFAVMANALTTECVFLDGAAHQPTEAIEAWSELVEIMFSSIRDGYYTKIRYLRKNSHCFNTMFSQSSDLSNEETPATTPKPTDF